MIYEHHCDPCDVSFDVRKDSKDYMREEPCPKCEKLARRVPFPRRTYLAGTAVEEKYFSHALGQVVTKSEEKRIAKSKGMIEVGNEKVEKHVKPELHSYDDVWQGAG